MHKKNPVTILITGGGAPGIAGTIYSLRKNPDKINTRIIAVDMKEDAVGKYLADSYYKIPSADDPDFIENLFELSIQEKVDVILPQVTKELMPLAAAIGRFEERGIQIAVSSKDSINKANDKFYATQIAEKIKIPVPLTILTRTENDLINAVKKLGFPEKRVVVKPRVSNGMRGLRVVCQPTWDVCRFLNEKPEGTEIGIDDLIKILKKGTWPELLVQEYLPGDEYTIDVFRGLRYEVAIPRLREEIRSGITFRALVDEREDLKGFALSLAKEIGLNYAFGFQFKLSGSGEPKLLECNPRIQGTMVVSTIAGYNIIWSAVREAIKEPVADNSSSLRRNMRFIRYWGGIGVENGRKIDQI